MPSKMTRRKQNAPKRLKSTDKAGSNLSSHQSENSSQITTESGAGEGDEEEEEGDTTTDEENMTDVQVDTATSHTETHTSQVTDTSGHDVDAESKGSPGDKTVNFLEKKNSQKSCSKSRTEHNHCDQEMRKPAPAISHGTSTPSLPPIKGLSWKSHSPGSKSSRYKYSCKLSPPVVQSSPALTLAGLDTQMALMMSSLPLGLLSGVKNSPSPQDPAQNYVAQGQAHQDDQPLDLSKKCDRPLSRDRTADFKHSSTSVTSANSTSNGFSSLQSLQQRFGGDYPLGLSQKPSGAVISLQPSMIHKSTVVPHTLAVSTDNNTRSAASKIKPGTRSDWLERQEGTSASDVSPVLKGGNSRHTSPLLGEDAANDAGGKHTIHRCSCQKSFSTLYALSLHLQETGHIPASSKSASLMDYPKLVRGQDMWLNQESEQTRRILRCMQCGESFKSLPLLTVHMMQTQHYTKIVSSDHGRRSHKCSTYCDRELDKECIFKCKVCHEAYSDMEGLANHMIISGHHKKPSSHQIPTSTEFTTDLSSIARQGRRKRFLPGEITSGTCSSSVAALLEHRHKQAVSSHSGLNGFHPDSKNQGRGSPEVQSLRQVQCDSCGKSVGSREFDSHVRACLKHRAEVIDALKNKLAVEEALLSKSESKLLRSGFRLSSVSGHREYSFMNAGSRAVESSSSEDHENFYDKHHEDGCPDGTAQIKCERTSPIENQSSVLTESRHLPKNNETSAKICDLIEVPLKKWYCSSDDSGQTAKGEEQGSPTAANINISPLSKTEMNHDTHLMLKKEGTEQRLKQVGKRSFSPGVGEKRKLSDSDSAKDGFTNIRKKDRMSPSLVHESGEESLDFTSSALHKLDMFSRGLKFSPPRRNVSPESKLPTHCTARVTKKREHQASAIAKSPQPSSPQSQLQIDSPDLSKKNMTFDIIDPNADTGPAESSSSALEAMESFIHKSFSAKSDLRSSSLASMFSPFRNCLPLLGSLPGQAGALPDPSDRTLTHFAKFSKFFGMVPGVPHFTESPVNSLDTKKIEVSQPRLPPSALPEPWHGLPHDKTTLTSKKTSFRPQTSSSAIKIPKFSPDLPPGDTSTDNHKTSGGKKVDISPSSKKYRQPSSLDALILSARYQNHHQGPSSHSSGNRGLQTDNSDSSSKIEKSSGLEISQDEPKRKRKHEMTSDLEGSDLKLRNIKCESSKSSDKDTNAIEKIDNKIKEEVIESLEEDHRAENDEAPLFSLQKQKSTDSCLLEPSKVCHQDNKNVTDDEEVNTKLHENSDVLSQDDLQCQVSVKTEVKDDKNQTVFTEAGSKEPSEIHTNKTDEDNAEMSYENSRQNQTQWDKSRVEDEQESLVKSAVFCKQVISVQEKSWYDKTSKDSCESSYHDSDGDVDTDDEDDGDDFTVRAGMLLSRKTKEKRKIKTRDHESNIQKISNLSEKHFVVSAVAVKIEVGDHMNDDDDNDHDSGNSNVPETDVHSPNIQLVENSPVRNNCDIDMKSSQNNELDSKRSVSYCIKTTGSPSSISTSEEQLNPVKRCSLDNLDKAPTSLEDSNGGEDKHLCNPQNSENKPLFSAQNSKISKKKSTCNSQNMKLTEGMDKQDRKSALDSLSSFVYSQPLTSEHPLDSLHRLLSTNDLAHLSSDHLKYSPATSHKCLTPDIPLPLNLTSKGGGVISSGGCSSDDNEDIDPALVEGGAADGELREYKCAACNRKFASKGSYRYHLSRCHLSSVKKYGIKEAFNMSPYVYLPLDHTAKFSKYYQLAHELANKGK